MCSGFRRSEAGFRGPQILMLDFGVGLTVPLWSFKNLIGDSEFQKFVFSYFFGKVCLLGNGDIMERGNCF